MVDLKDFVPVIYQGRVFKNKVINDKGEVYNKKTNKFLNIRERKDEDVYLCPKRKLRSGKNRVRHEVSLGNGHITLSRLIAESFSSRVKKSPLVRAFDLKLGDDVVVTTETGKEVRLIVSTDHIDGDHTNNILDNIRWATQVEQNANRVCLNQLGYKGVRKRGNKFFAYFGLGRTQEDLRIKIRSKSRVRLEEAALDYNDLIIEGFSIAFGEKIAREIHDEVAYLNVVKKKQLMLDLVYH